MSLSHLEPIRIFDPGTPISDRVPESILKKVDFDISSICSELPSQVHRPAMVYLSNGSTISLTVLLDSGATHANYISPSAITEINERMQPEQLTILKPDRTYTATLADGITKYTISGIVKLQVSIVDSKDRAHTASLIFHVFPCQPDTSAIIGLPTLCTVYQDLFFDVIIEAAPHFTPSQFDSMVSQVRLLPIEFDRGQYEVHNQIWSQPVSDLIAPEEHEVPEFGVNFMTSNTFAENKSNFLEAFDSQIFPIYFREGQPNIPQCVVDFKDFLRAEGYRAFQPSEQGWTFIKGIEVSIDLKENSPSVIHHNPRPVAHTLRSTLDKYIDDLLTYFWVPEYESTVVTPLVVAPKSDGGIRVCGAYNVTVNKITKLPSYAIPFPRDKVKSVIGSAWMAKIDVKRAFHNLALDLQSSKLLTIATHRGNFRPLGMPEGVIFGTQYLQQVMTLVLDSCEKYCLVLFDDLFLHAPTLELFCSYFIWVLRRCIAVGIVLSLEKTSFGTEGILFGMRVSKSGYEMDPARLQGLRDVGFPTTSSEVRSVMGLFNFVSDFCPRYADIAAPLFEMSTKKFNWDAASWKIDYRHHFELLKHACTDCLVRLAFPDYEKEWVTYSDASMRAVCGIIVMLVKADGEERQFPLAIYSKKLSGSALNWSTIQAEAFAIYNTYANGRDLLLGKPHDLLTDHANLLQMEKSERPMIRNICAYLQQFQISKILHVRTHENPADHPTRSPIISSSNNHVSTVTHSRVFCPTCPFIYDHLYSCWIQSMSEDEVFDRMDMLTLASSVHWKDSNSACRSTSISETKHFLSTLQLSDDDLFKLKAVHSGRTGHWGFRKTKQILDEENPGHGLSDSDISLFIIGCNICQKNRAYARPAVIPFDKTHHKFPDNDGAFRHMLSIDLLKLPPTSKGNAILCVILNHFTKRVRYYVQRDNTARSLSVSFFQHYSVHGPFCFIKSDEGSDLMSQSFTLLREYLGKPDQLFVHLPSLPYRPQAHGTEPSVKKAVQALRDILNDPDWDSSWEWDDPITISTIECVVNFSRNSETGAIPIAVETGDPDIYFDLPDDLSTMPEAKTTDFILLVQKRMSIIRKILSKNHSILHEKRSELNNPARNELLQPGQFVTHRSHKAANKLKLPRLGPYLVLEHLYNSNDVKCRDLISDAIVTFHSSTLSLFPGSAEKAREAAQLDDNQHVISKIVAYTGDVMKKTTLEFLVRFADDSESWVTWSSDIDQTQQFEIFCRSKPQLFFALLDSKQAALAIADIKRSPIYLDQDSEVYVDLRRWDEVWYSELDLPNYLTITYVVKGIYGQAHNEFKFPRIDITFPALDESFIGAKGMDSVFIKLWGSNSQFHPDWVLIDDDFLLKYPHVLDDNKRKKRISDIKRSILK